MNPEIKNILHNLHESVNKEEKRKAQLKESEELHTLIHTALEIWDSLDHTSHTWHVSPSGVLRMVAAQIFGNKVASLSLGKIWKQLSHINTGKFKQILKAARIINKARSAEDAINQIETQLGIEITDPETEQQLAGNTGGVQPALAMGEAKKPVAKKVKK